MLHCAVFVLSLVVATRCQVPPPIFINYTRQGDFMLGGLVPFHFGPICQGGLGVVSVEVAQTIAFTVQQVNERADLLPNHTLGFDIRETCYNEDMTLLSVLSLLSSYSDRDPILEVTGRPQPPPTGHLVGIVGTVQSATSLAAAKPINLYGVPMVSYSATSDELSDKDRFPFFLRTVAPDKFQARTILDILVRFRWIYVGLIYSLDTYGILGSQELIALADREGVCVAFSIAVRAKATASEIKETVEKMATHNRAKVLVMYGEYEGMYVALQEFHDAYPNEKRTLICSDAFGQDFGDYDFARMIQGSINIRLDFQMIPGILEYLRGLSQQSDPSPWYTAISESWMSKKNCSDLASCPLKFSGIWMPIYLSVYAFAHALDDFVRQLCPGMSAECVADAPGKITGRHLLPYLLKVEFEAPIGKFQFDDNGDPTGTYLIATVGADAEGQITRKDIGYWDWHLGPDALSIDEASIPWPGSEPTPPISVCRDVCQPGHVEVPQEEKCCWECQKCDANEMVDSNQCKKCPQYHWPSEDFTFCQRIAPRTIPLHDAVVITLLALCTVGFMVASLSIIGMFYYKKHPLIKATGREVSLITLAGTILAYLTIFPFLSYPTNGSCAVSEAMVSLGFTMTYAPTLLKVNRICRIFEAGKKSTKPPSFIRPKDQIILVMLLILIQVLIVAVSSLAGSLSRPEFLMPEKLVNYLEIYCLFGSGFLASCVYNLLLILGCCYYAFRTRKVPSNYNESKFIAVSVYSTLVLCLAAVPVYTTAVAVLQKVATLCIAVVLNAYLTLVCVYLPKLYAARFVKDVALLKCSTTGTGDTSITRVHPMPAPSASGAVSQGVPPPVTG